MAQRMLDRSVAPRDVPAARTRSLRFFWLLLPVFLLVRLAYAASLELAPDEAYYWVWSRRLAASYFDHPPMIAYFIRLSTFLLGSIEIGVRLPAVLLAAGSMIVVVLLARRLFREWRPAAAVAAIWFTSPLLAGIATILTPDTPATFFSVCALACAAVIADRDDRAEMAGPADSAKPASSAGLWLLFGVFCGLALLSKYTAILLPLAVGIALFTSEHGRAHLRRPWVYLAAGIALLIFSPVIWWNEHHQYASFAYQWRHGMEADAVPAPISLPGRALQALQDLGMFAGGQALIWTPILFGAALVVLFRSLRRYKTLKQVDQVLLCCGALPLIFFAATELLSHNGEVNWPAFAYFPISLLLARYVSENWQGRRVDWLRAGCTLALGMNVVLHVVVVPRAAVWLDARLGRLPRWVYPARRAAHLPRGLMQMIGWREFGQFLDREGTGRGAIVLTNRHTEAAEASFYMPGQPDVWCVGIGSRPTAYDYFDDPPNWKSFPVVFWIGGHVDKFCQQYGYVEERTVVATYPRLNKRWTGRVLVRPLPATRGGSGAMAVEPGEPGNR